MAIIIESEYEDGKDRLAVEICSQCKFTVIEFKNRERCPHCGAEFNDISYEELNEE